LDTITLFAVFAGKMIGYGVPAILWLERVNARARLLAREKSVVEVGDSFWCAAEMNTKSVENKQKSGTFHNVASKEGGAV
jgi:hypothetical protein